MAQKFLTHIDLTKNEIQNVRLHVLATAPALPVTGQCYFNSTDNICYWWNGTVWKPFGGTVADVQGTTPIQVTNVAGVYTVSILPATGSVAGSMSAADKTKLDAATSSNTANTLVIRDGAGRFQASDPVAPQDVVTKAYADAIAQGLDAKGSVKAATTAAITLSGAQTIDGVAVVAGDRVLVKDQASAAANGVYVVAAGAWTRATDNDTWLEVPSAFVFVEQGTVNADSGWLCTSDSGGTIGTTAITWVQFSGAGQITAGAGLTKTGSQLDVVNTDNSITVNADDIAAKRKAAGGIGLDANGMFVEGYTPTAGTTVTKKWVGTASVGGGTVATVTHNLASKDVSVTLYNSTDEKVIADVATPTTNTVSITANGTTQTLRVVVVG